MPQQIRLTYQPGELQRLGPIIKVVIGNPKPDLDEATALGFEFSPAPPINAVIDTGAAVTIINPELAQFCHLRYTGPARISGVGHSGTYREFAASISFPNTNLRAFDILRIVACPLSSKDISCLVGRDVLRHWEVGYNGQSGQITITDLRTVP